MPQTAAGSGGEPDTLAVQRVIERVNAVYARWGRNTDIKQMRDDWDAFFPPAGASCNIEAVKLNGLSAVWVEAPEVTKNRVMLYLHGGGFKLGSTRSHQDLMARLSAACDCRVLGLDYRLVPESRFPAPLEDSLSALAWLEDEGFGIEDVVLAGDSAGGNLVAASLLSRKSEGKPMPACAVMMSPLLDFSATAPSYESRRDVDPFHNRTLIHALGKSYLGEERDWGDPLASPYYGELDDLPPLLIQVGDREVGRDESALFADKARAAGTQIELEIWDGMIHVFQQFTEDLPQAREALKHIGRFVRGHWREQ